MERIFNFITSIPIPDEIRILLLCLFFLASFGYMLHKFKSDFDNMKTSKGKKRKKNRTNVCKDAFALVVIIGASLVVGVSNKDMIMDSLDKHSNAERDNKVSHETEQEIDDAEETDFISPLLSDPTVEQNTQTVSAQEIKYYNTQCRMRLGPITGTEEFLITYEERIFFGLLSKDTEEISNKDYERIERELLGAINMQKANTLDEMEEEYQRQVISVTNKHDNFFLVVEDIQANPPVWPGSEEWYEQWLPKSEELLTIADKQEEFFELSPDIELAQQLVNDYCFLGAEYAFQGFSFETVEYFYAKAALFLMQKLEFEDITIDNCYKTLKDLKGAFESLSLYEGAGEDVRVKRSAQIIADMIEKFIDLHLTMKTEENDPIVYAGYS